MIKPTIGRVVWVWRNQTEDPSQPEAATVVFVNSDISVNVIGHSKHGRIFFLGDLLLKQDEDTNQIPPWPYAEWMPYQKGQAQKTEELEKQIGHGG
jgi:hypothetical protein